VQDGILCDQPTLVPAWRLSQHSSRRRWFSTWLFDEVEVAEREFIGDKRVQCFEQQPANQWLRVVKEGEAELNRSVSARGYHVVVTWQGFETSRLVHLMTSLPVLNLHTTRHLLITVSQLQKSGFSLHRFE